MDLFVSDAPWQRSAQKVSVFQLYGAYLEHAPQDQVDKIVKDLKKRHIAIAVEAGVINMPSAAKPSCGGVGVEGYATTARATAISEKIKKAGGVISYIAMDEPLWFGRYYKGAPGKPPGCRLAIEELIDLTMPVLKVYLDEFPSVQIGDIEPSGVAYQPGWQDDLVQWLAGYRVRLGRSVSFVHLDVPFSAGNQAVVAALRFYNQLLELKATGSISTIGIIYNGLPRDVTDQAWVDSAKSHISFFEDKHNMRPSHAIIQSWTKSPTRTLPETASDTLTGLALHYIDRLNQASIRER
ncbi:hypothetical protein [Bradyrhizobium sp. 62]|uniref:hypothetical protein n=1 Tax=Bradyrhizobium sp. 62 TaxID=1043588 RepID=UPI001FFB6B40|nr:hypothetical protein [Bradyrhizobium sp. 62]MCK1368316.1 hypothetical protein [Bradyrhizobium sp. 62]